MNDYDEDFRTSFQNHEVLEVLTDLQHPVIAVKEALAASLRLICLENLEVQEKIHLLA